MSDPGPITAALEDEVQQELRDRGIVAWLDRDGHYSAFGDALAGRYEHSAFFAPVLPFRGSYLEMLSELAAYGNGLDAEQMLVHMPGHTEDLPRRGEPDARRCRRRPRRRRVASDAARSHSKARQRVLLAAARWHCPRVH